MTDVATTRTLVEDVAARGRAGRVDAATVYAVASRSGLADPPSVRALAVGLVAEVLTRGLMVPGDVGPGGHRPWPLSPPEAVARIAEDWFSRANPKVSFGEVASLANTPAGAELGDAVIAEWYAERADQ